MFKWITVETEDVADRHHELLNCFLKYLKYLCFLPEYEWQYVVEDLVVVFLMTWQNEILITFYTVAVVTCFMRSTVSGGQLYIMHYAIDHQTKSDHQNRKNSPCSMFFFVSCIM